MPAFRQAQIRGFGCTDLRDLRGGLENANRTTTIPVKVENPV